MLDITWLANANLADTNAFGVAGINANGSMSWTRANLWIGAMNATDYLGFDNWRLPSALNQDGTGPCFGLNCNSSEMGYMFYENFGVSAGSSVTTSTDANFALFDNVLSDNYWSGSELATGPLNAWGFSFASGDQGATSKLRDLFAWAVRDGDVGGAASVPEPATTALLGVSLIGFVAVRRRARLLLPAWT